MTPLSLQNPCPRGLSKYHVKPRSSGAGFTLVEMLAVICLISILAVLTVPSLTGLSSAGKFNSAVSGLSETLSLARQTAVARNTYVWVAFALPSSTAAGSSLSTLVVASTDGTNPFTDWSSTVTLPDSRLVVVTKPVSYAQTQFLEAGTLTSQQIPSLSGGGTVNNTGFTTTIASGAFLTPSSVTAAATQLTFNGNLALAGSTTLTIYSGANDSVALSGGSLTYGGTMTVAISGTESNNTYALFSGESGTSADFSGVTVDGTALTDNSGVWTGVGSNSENVTFYTTGAMDGDLILGTASVPEPGTWALCLGGLGLLIFHFRRRPLSST